MERKIIYNGRIILPDEIYRNGAVVINEFGIIDDIIKVENGRTLEDLIKKYNERIDAEEGLIAPGTIAIHEHGLDDFEFLGISDEDLIKVLKKYTEFGVTSVSPTLATASLSNVKRTLNTIFNVARKRSLGARLLRTHLESWYFNEEMAGAQEVSLFKNPDFEEFCDLIRESFYIGIVTLAPELPGSLEFINAIRQIFPELVLSIGHSNSSVRDASLAFDLGVRLVNHIYNRVAQDRDYAGYRVDLDDRLKNIIQAVLEDERVYIELICDFVHVNEDYVERVIRRKGFDKTILITDSSSMAGSDKKKGTLSGKEFERREKRRGYPAAYYNEDGKFTLVGSVLTPDKGIRNINDAFGYKLSDTFKMVSSTPAALLRLTRSINTGSIERKKLADIVVYDYDEKNNRIGNVRYTFVGGNLAYP